MPSTVANVMIPANRITPHRGAASPQNDPRPRSLLSVAYGFQRWSLPGTNVPGCITASVGAIGAVADDCTMSIVAPGVAPAPAPAPCGEVSTIGGEVYIQRSSGGQSPTPAIDIVVVPGATPTERVK